MVLKMIEILKIFFFYQEPSKVGMQGIALLVGLMRVSSHFVSGLPYPPYALPWVVCNLRLLEIYVISSVSSVLIVLFACLNFYLSVILFLLSMRGST